MRIKSLVALTLLFAAGCSGVPPRRAGADLYPNFAALRAANTEGLDYSREAYDRGSRVAVLALHGGDIETGTARVARRVAGKDLNLYVFSGWHGESNDLHITAAHFDDPAAVMIATSSVLGVSIHAQTDRGSWVCVGGANAKAAFLMASRLEAAGFPAETPCARLPGTSPSNIVNRASAGGVQLEITLRLLARLERDPEDLSKFTEAVRMAALEFVSSVK
jgi:phage replication-related protein YjqB (UPF0714/DUF867 family)